MSTHAKDIMTTELIIGHPKMTVEEAIKTLVNNRITGLPIVDSERRIVGVLSEYDIIKTVEKVEKEEKDRPIDLSQTIQFTESVVTIEEEAKLDDVLKHFIDLKVRRLPVVNKKKQLVGIITRRDIMRVLFYRSKKI